MLNYISKVFLPEQIFTVLSNRLRVKKEFPYKDIKIQPFPLPPLTEQHEIVRYVVMLFERADAIDREVVAASRRCERLTQAVLGKAFAGKL